MSQKDGHSGPKGNHSLSGRRRVAEGRSASENGRLLPADCQSARGCAIAALAADIPGDRPRACPSPSRTATGRNCGSPTWRLADPGPTQSNCGPNTRYSTHDGRHPACAIDCKASTTTRHWSERSTTVNSAAQLLSCHRGGVRCQPSRKEAASGTNLVTRPSKNLDGAERDTDRSHITSSYTYHRFLEVSRSSSVSRNKPPPSQQRAELLCHRPPRPCRDTDGGGNL